MTYIKPDDEWRVDAAPTRSLPDLTGVHDSDRCRCEQCRWASEQERQQSAPVTTQQSLWADAATVRAALFDTLDENTEELYAFDCEKHRVTDEGATEGRCNFVDAVLRRIAQLQQPPHNYPRRPVDGAKE